MYWWRGWRPARCWRGLRPRSSRSASVATWSGLTGSRGNPDLLPFLATNYDLGLEWYFSDTNYASLAIFRKEISRFILIRAVDEVNPNDGQTYSITSPHQWR